MSNFSKFFYVYLFLGEVLEIGALWSVRVQDIPSFERYIAQLKVYYQDLRLVKLLKY